LTARRIGVFGGSFDPPHLAHRALAEAACETLALDTLLCVPAGAPWQKSGRALAGAGHRVAMLRALLVDQGRCQIDERELHRPGPSYSIDTVSELAAERPGATLFLVVGQDQYARLDTWHRWRELLGLCTLAVAARASDAVQAPPALRAVPHRLQVLPMPRLDISASDIRVRLAQGLPVGPMVGEPVARYIDRHALYRC
jgi:nicotinate-nucleotide adenylyltransferase